jgi:hypothetical protein
MTGAQRKSWLLEANLSEGGDPAISLVNPPAALTGEGTEWEDGW